MGPPNKKRKTESKVEEVTFDLDARQDYLTGFHKRKLQRAKFAQEKAAERARLDRIEARKKLREERKADLERHVKAVNDLLRAADQPLDGGSDNEDSENGESWGGIEDAEPEPVDHEAEYVDEDKYTTVLVEEMDVTKEGLMKVGQDRDNDSLNGKSPEPDAVAAEDEDAESVSKSDKKKIGKRPWSKDKPKDKDAPRKPRKKRNFRYEGKLERKASRFKQKRKNSEQAKARKTT